MNAGGQKNDLTVRSLRQDSCLFMDLGDLGEEEEEGLGMEKCQVRAKCFT